MRFLKNFSGYYNNENYSVNEEAGYGNDYFVDEKIEKSQYYFFKVGEGDSETGIILKIGKFSKSSVISENEKNYGVIHIENIDPNDLDDYLVNDSEYKSKEDEIFNMDEDLLNQTFMIITKALDNYLEKNPKVTMIYDEILENLDMSQSNYLDFISPKIKSWSKGRWNVQEGPSDKILIYTKVSHE